MKFYTKREQEWLASLSNKPYILEPWDWPTSTIPDVTTSPELGTMASPIVIGDDAPPLGSPSNPILIREEEGGDKTQQTGSDADTELILTPEFWNSVMNFDHPHRATVVDLTQDSRLVGSSGSQNTAEPPLLCDSPAICNQKCDDSSRVIEVNERSVGSSDSYDTAHPQLLCASPTTSTRGSVEADKYKPRRQDLPR